MRDSQTGGNAAALAAKAATRTIPVVFHGSIDPVEAGFVASLNRPGGNMTGVVTLNIDTGQKRLELIHELVPSAGTIALLLNPTNPIAETQSKDLQAAARTLGLNLHVLHASTEPEFEPAVAALRQLGAGGLVIGTDGFLVSHSEVLAALIIFVATYLFLAGTELPFLKLDRPGGAVAGAVAMVAFGVRQWRFAPQSPGGRSERLARAGIESEAAVGRLKS